MRMTTALTTTRTTMTNQKEVSAQLQCPTRDADPGIELYETEEDESGERRRRSMRGGRG